MSRNLSLLAVIILGFFLRFWDLSINPSSLTWDEAAWGYNAYALSHDARDEFGKFLPIAFFESFGDFKPPVYAYLSIIPTIFFGLNEFSTRFPSAFFGVLSILFTYFLTREIFKVASNKQKYINANNIGLLAAFVLSISPWHILLSRAAFEANVATFFIILGVYFFLKANEKGYFLSLSIFSFVISMYTFNTARIVAPMLVLTMFVFNHNKLLVIKRDVAIAIVVGFFTFLPLFLFLLTPQARLRFAEVNIFSDVSIIERANTQISNDDDALWSKILHNRRLAYATSYLKHYFDNLSPSFLFIKGDGNPKFSIQDVGQMYLWEIPFIIGGIFLLIRKREGFWWIVPMWLIIGLIPAGTARETPHALRIETAIPTFQIFSAYGLFYFLQNISKIKYKLSKIYVKYLIYILCIFFIIFNFLYFLHNYFTHYSREFSGEWQYGYKDAIRYVKQVESKYDAIYFTEALGRPYIYFLYYMQYDPEKFRKNSKIEREVFGFVHVRSFDKYYFDKSITNIPNRNNILYIDTPGKVPNNATIQKTFKLLKGEIVLVAYTL